jgi:hypothetical protein
MRENMITPETKAMNGTTLLSRAKHAKKHSTPEFKTKDDTT